ncbi:MAG: DMT family transporter [Erysipelotrichaceae bacterium]|nr:DMT family transporter [Erysipelotrichaceae bacterium]
MKKYASLMVLLGAAFWASNGVFVNLFEGSGLSPVEKMCLRCFIAVAIETLIIFFYDRRQFIVDIKDLPWFALAGIFGVFLFGATYNLCISRVGMGIAGVLIYLMPIMVMIYAVVFKKEKFTLMKGVMLGLNLFGCALVSGVMSGGRFDLLGIGYGVITALFYALNNIITADRLNKYSVLARVYYPGFFACICGVIYLLLTGRMTGVVSVMADPHYLLIGICWALCCSILSYFFFNAALDYLDVTKVSILSTFEPVATILFGLFLLGEHIDLYGVIGVILVITSLILGEVKDPSSD